VFSWIPAFAGMTSFSVINVVADRPIRGIEKKYVSVFMNQCTKESIYGVNVWVTNSGSNSVSKL
jgi:hypothetical protein